MCVNSFGPHRSSVRRCFSWQGEAEAGEWQSQDLNQVVWGSWTGDAKASCLCLCHSTWKVFCVVYKAHTGWVRGLCHFIPLCLFFFFLDFEIVTCSLRIFQR